MLQQLKIEWLKMKNYTAFIAISLIFLICVFGVNYIGYNINSSAQSTAAGAFVGSYFGFPHVWHTVAWLSSFTLFLPGLLIILMVTNEFTYRTHRQNVIDGWSRDTFIRTKIASVFILAAVATLWVGLMALMLGLISGGSLDFYKVQYIGFFFLQSLSIFMAALLISILVKRAALSIAIFIAYVYIIENILGAIINAAVFNFVKNKSSMVPLADVLPINTTDALLPFPFFRELLDKSTGVINPWILFGLAMAYLAAYVYFARRHFLTRDL
jgi:ABC-2 type transport system permease protein